MWGPSRRDRVSDQEDRAKPTDGLAPWTQQSEGGELQDEEVAAPRCMSWRPRRRERIPDSAPDEDDRPEPRDAVVLGAERSAGGERHEGEGEATYVRAACGRGAAGRGAAAGGWRCEVGLTAVDDAQTGRPAGTAPTSRADDGPSRQPVPGRAHELSIEFQEEHDDLVKKTPSVWSSIGRRPCQFLLLFVGVTCSVLLAVVCMSVCVSVCLSVGSRIAVVVRVRSCS